MNSQLVNKNGGKIRRIDVLGVGVDDLDEREVEREIVRLAKAPGRGHYLVTINSEFVMMAHRNRKFAQILAKSDLAVADGWFVAKSRLICGGRFGERITGVDLIELASKIADDKPIRIGYMGGFGDVAPSVAKRQLEIHPGIDVVYAKPGEPTISHDSRLKAELDAVGRIDVLFVAFGMGKQEFWIDRMRGKLDIGLYIGVGGAFDYIAGKKRRAPEFMQKIGLEWLWRLVHDPVRIWRMRVLPIFAFLIFLKLCKKIFFRIFFQKITR